MTKDDIACLKLSINEIKHQLKQTANNFKRSTDPKYNQQCQINSGIQRLRNTWKEIAYIEKKITNL